MGRERRGGEEKTRGEGNQRDWENTGEGQSERESQCGKYWEGAGQEE